MSTGDNSRFGEGLPVQSAAWIDGDASAGEARVGEARLVKGGARVATFTEEPPAAGAVPFKEGRILTAAEIDESGLLQDRVIEIGEMREEAVVSKQAVVREELVVRKHVEERTERVSDTLRRTEVDVERIEAGPEPAQDRQDAGDAQAR